MNETDNQPIKMCLTFTASPWKDVDESSLSGAVRRWDNPPPEEDDEDDADLAAVVELSGWCWPFRRWTWRVYSPFEAEAVETDTAGSKEEAQRQADVSLRRMIAEALASAT